MAFKNPNNVFEPTTTTGTTDFSLSGTASDPRYSRFQDVLSNGDKVWYKAIFRGTTNEWEIGIGTWVSSGNVLQRTTVHYSSVTPGGTSTKVSFSAGTKDVMVVSPGPKVLIADDAGIVTAGPIKATAAGSEYGLRANGIANVDGLYVAAHSTSGQSKGALIDGGTTSADYGLAIRTYAGLDSFRVRGDKVARAYDKMLVDGQLQISDGTVSLPGESFQNDPDCGRYRIGTNNYGDSVAANLIVEYRTTGIKVYAPGGADGTVYHPMQLIGGYDGNGWDFQKFTQTGISTTAVQVCEAGSHAMWGVIMWTNDSNAWFDFLTMAYQVVPVKQFHHLKTGSRPVVTYEQATPGVVTARVDSGANYRTSAAIFGVSQR